MVSVIIEAIIYKFTVPEHLPLRVCAWSYWSMANPLFSVPVGINISAVDNGEKSFWRFFQQEMTRIFFPCHMRVEKTAIVAENPYMLTQIRMLSDRLEDVKVLLVGWDVDFLEKVDRSNRAPQLGHCEHIMVSMGVFLVDYRPNNRSIKVSPCRNQSRNRAGVLESGTPSILNAKWNFKVRGQPVDVLPGSLARRYFTTHRVVRTLDFVFRETPWPPVRFRLAESSWLKLARSRWQLLEPKRWEGDNTARNYRRGTFRRCKIYQCAFKWLIIITSRVWDGRDVEISWLHHCLVHSMEVGVLFTCGPRSVPSHEPSLHPLRIQLVKFSVFFCDLPPFHFNHHYFINFTCICV